MVVGHLWGGVDGQLVGLDGLLEGGVDQGEPEGRVLEHRTDLPQTPVLLVDNVGNIEVCQ